MKKSDIYEIAVKILGLYLFFTAIGFLRDLITNLTFLLQTNNNPDLYGDFNQTPLFIASIVNFSLVIAFAIFLTFGTKLVTKKICKAEDFKETVSLFAKQNEIYQIALILLGLIVIVWTLPEFAFRLNSYIQHVQNDLPLNSYDTNFVFTAGIKIIVGFLAIYYSTQISTLLSKKSNDKINKTNGNT